LTPDHDHQAASGRHERVFVIDDDCAVRAAITLLVRSCGWEAVPCASAEEFLQHYSPALGQCLVLDQRMPGLSGVQLQRELRERGDRVPVIMVTAHRGLPEADKAYLYGAYAVLGKPVDGTELEGWIRRALDSQQSKTG
jgi:FixJ family two-component response regulator